MSTALQFMESFGLRATSVDAETEDGKEVTLQLEPGVSRPPFLISLYCECVQVISEGARKAMKQTLYTCSTDTANLSSR